MNRETTFSTAADSRAESIRRGAAAPVSLPWAGAAATFRDRYEECRACDTAVTSKCDECGGTGEVLAGCADCSMLEPLDDDGLCRKCSDGKELTTAEFLEKYPSGWGLAELSAYLMGVRL